MKRPEFRQTGVVLLLLLLVFLIAGTSMMLGVFNTRQDIYLQQQAELANQMQLAKETLLAFAANSSAIFQNSRGPGFFPCPDIDNDAVPEADCDSSLVNLGRLPQYTTDSNGNRIFFNSYYAKANRQFWYAVAPHYVYSSDEDHRNAINRTAIDALITDTRLTVDAADNVVAVILAPGESMDFQNRDTGILAADNFLEGGNEDADRTFFTTAADPAAFNDQLITITHDELMPYIAGNVALEIKRLLDGYYEMQPDPKHYPGNPDAPSQNYHADFAAVLASHAWLKDTSPNNEQWAANTMYELISATKATVMFDGCTNMSFTLDYEGGVTRNGKSC